MGDKQIDSVLKATHHVFSNCFTQTKRGLAIHAATSTSRYPYVYVRDMACAINFFVEAKSFRLAKDACHFLLNVQHLDGSWGQRYSVSGQNMSYTEQEDNVPLAIWAITEYILKSRDKAFAVEAFPKLEKAIKWMRSNSLNTSFYLCYATTSIHETAINKGYDIWTNSAACKAHYNMSLLAKTLQKEDVYLRSAKLIEKSIKKYLVDDGRFIRKLEITGEPDNRPDIITYSPVYFGIVDANDKMVATTMEHVRENLTDPDLGGIQRYLPFSSEGGINTNVPGPWLFYTAWVAQYHYRIKDHDFANYYMNWIMQQAPDGFLPEHVSTAERFELWKKLDLPKQLSTKEGDDRHLILRQVEQFERESQQGNGRINYAKPLVWSHIEFLRALLLFSPRKYQPAITFVLENLSLPHSLDSERIFQGPLAVYAAQEIPAGSIEKTGE